MAGAAQEQENLMEQAPAAAPPPADVHTAAALEAGEGTAPPGAARGKRSRRTSISSVASADAPSLRAAPRDRPSKRSKAAAACEPAAAALDFTHVDIEGEGSNLTAASVVGEAPGLGGAGTDATSKAPVVRRSARTKQQVV